MGAGRGFRGQEGGDKHIDKSDIRRALQVLPSIQPSKP